jgi:hypothetical protein
MCYPVSEDNLSGYENDSEQAAHAIQHLDAHICDIQTSKNQFCQKSNCLRYFILSAF